MHPTGMHYCSLFKGLQWTLFKWASTISVKFVILRYLWKNHAMYLEISKQLSRKQIVISALIFRLTQFITITVYGSKSTKHMYFTLKYNFVGFLKMRISVLWFGAVWLLKSLSKRRRHVPPCRKSTHLWLVCNYSIFIMAMRLWLWDYVYETMAWMLMPRLLDKTKCTFISLQSEFTNGDTSTEFTSTYIAGIKVPGDYKIPLTYR